MIPPSSMRAAHDFWELIMTSWSPEPFREDRTRKFSIGVLNAVENLAKRKSLFGTHLFPNVAGEMKAAPTCKRPRSNQVGATATIFKPGWICMKLKKAEHRGLNTDRRSRSDNPGNGSEPSSSVPQCIRSKSLRKRIRL